MASHAFAVAAFGAALAFSNGALARELEYSAPDGCPTHSSVKERIDRDPGGRDVRILVERDGGTHRGVIAMGEGADRVSRTVEARSCGAVVDALILVAAIDQAPPPAATAPQPAPVVEPAPIPPAPAPTNANPDRPSEPPPKEDPDARTLTTLGGGFGTVDFANNERFASFFIVGEIMPDVRLFGVSWMRPSFQLRFARSLDAEVMNLPEKATFSLTSATLDACPFSNLRVNDWFTFNFCARGEAGALAASTNGGSATRGWLMAAPIVIRPHIYFTKTGVRPHLMFDSFLGFPLIRERFRVLEQTVRADAFVFGSAVAFGVTLP